MPFVNRSYCHRVMVLVTGVNGLNLVYSSEKKKVELSVTQWSLRVRI
jgi:hypothetical protein